MQDDPRVNRWLQDLSTILPGITREFIPVAPEYRLSTHEFISQEVREGNAGPE